MNLLEEITEIARRHLTNIKKSGPTNIMATCPFHTKPDGSPERNPSFSMSLVTGLWLCFSCHESGNLRTFLRSVGIPPALLDQQYGTLIEEASKAVPERLDPLRPGVLTESPIPESLLGVFQYCPLDLVRDGFHEDVLEHFEVGFDKQHMRITYPLRDLSGQLFGISGRSVTGAEPRYKVYDQEYKVWGLAPRSDGTNKKRTIIWNAHRIYETLRDQVDGEIVLVEGFKACMWVHQAGITNVVALLGSWMSEEQQWILERLGARVYLMLDNDEAGLKGTHYIGKALSRSLRVNVCVYGDVDKQDQPDRVGPEEVRDAIKEAPSFITWLHA